MSLQDKWEKLSTKLDECQKLAVERLEQSIPSTLGDALTKYVEQGKAIAFREAVQLMKEILHEQELDSETD